MTSTATTRTPRGAGEIVEEVKDHFRVARNFTIEDKDGYLLTFSKRTRDVDFSQMQAPQQ